MDKEERPQVFHWLKYPPAVGGSRTWFKWAERYDAGEYGALLALFGRKRSVEHPLAVAAVLHGDEVIHLNSKTHSNRIAAIQWLEEQRTEVESRAEALGRLALLIKTRS